MNEIFQENEKEIDKILLKICYCFTAFYPLLFVFAALVTNGTACLAC